MCRLLTIAYFDKLGKLPSDSQMHPSCNFFCLIRDSQKRHGCPKDCANKIVISEKNNRNDTFLVGKLEMNVHRSLEIFFYLICF